MANNTATQVGIGGVIGGGSVLVADGLLRYFADDKPVAGTAGAEPKRPMLFEYAPLFSLLAGAAGTFGVYMWGGGSVPAVASAMCAAFAATSAPIDNYFVEARAEKDAKEAAAPGSNANLPGMATFANRLAGVQKAGL